MYLLIYDNSDPADITTQTVLGLFSDKAVVDYLCGELQSLKGLTEQELFVREMHVYDTKGGKKDMAELCFDMAEQITDRMYVEDTEPEREPHDPDHLPDQA